MKINSKYISSKRYSLFCWPVLVTRCKGIFQKPIDNLFWIITSPLIIISYRLTEVFLFIYSQAMMASFPSSLPSQATHWKNIFFLYTSVIFSVKSFLVFVIIWSLPTLLPSSLPHSQNCPLKHTAGHVTALLKFLQCFQFTQSQNQHR